MAGQLSGVLDGIPSGLLLAAGGLLLFAGAEALVRGAAGLALRLGVTPLAVGLTVVAFGTSMPELAVSVDAALDRVGDVAVGNVVGSNVANAGLILGLAALVRPLRVQVKLLRVDAPIALVAALLLTAFLGNGILGRGEGAVLLAGLLAYGWWAFHGARTAAAGGETVEVPGIARGRAAQGLAVALGLVLLVAGSHAFLVGAERAASAFGVSQAVIGLTVVAVGTSLPELATSTVAAWRRQGDVAVGNVVGSNIFNVLGILGVAALVSPLRVEGIRARDLGMMIVMALALLPLLRTGLRIGRREGALLLGAWLVYTISLYGT